MWVLQGLCWGWTDLPGPVARDKGEQPLGLEHLQRKLKGCGSPMPMEQRGGCTGATQPGCDPQARLPLPGPTDAVFTWKRVFPKLGFPRM